MPIPCYIAMTGAEFLHTDRFPDKIAWMACHYACYATGLSNLPRDLPEGALIIVNDRTPPFEQDAAFIAEQLLQLYEDTQPFGFLLDFQRADLAKNFEVAQAAIRKLPCPVAVSDLYAQELTAPVFLSLPPLDMPLQKYIAPWKGREIWLEVGLQAQLLTVTEAGCSAATTTVDTLPEPVFSAEEFFMRYHWEVTGDKAVFTLQRTKEDLDLLLETAEGITLAVGLYQQLGPALCP